MEPQACLSNLQGAGQLNLRIKPRKRLVREKPEVLAVPQGINQVWSMDFMHDQLQDGRTFRCNDPLKTCTGHTIGEINHEYDDGRRYQEVDGQAQGGFGGGDYSRKDFDLRGFPRLW
jgi:hypothetical protein